MVLIISETPLIFSNTSPITSIMCDRNIENPMLKHVPGWRESGGPSPISGMKPQT